MHGNTRPGWVRTDACSNSSTNPQADACAADTSPDDNHRTHDDDSCACAHDHIAAHGNHRRAGHDHGRS